MRVFGDTLFGDPADIQPAFDTQLTLTLKRDMGIWKSFGVLRHPHNQCCFRCCTLAHALEYSKQLMGSNIVVVAFVGRLITRSVH